MTGGAGWFLRRKTLERIDAAFPPWAAAGERYPEPADP